MSISIRIIVQDSSHESVISSDLFSNRLNENIDRVNVKQS